MLLNCKVELFVISENETLDGTVTDTRFLRKDSITNS